MTNTKFINQIKSDISRSKAYYRINNYKDPECITLDKRIKILEDKIVYLESKEQREKELDFICKSNSAWRRYMEEEIPRIKMFKESDLYSITVI